MSVHCPWAKRGIQLCSNLRAAAGDSIHGATVVTAKLPQSGQQREADSEVDSHSDFQKTLH